MADRLLHEEASLRALEHLHSRMTATATESNTFKARFHYSGLIAVVALLNVDLVLLKTPIRPATRALMLSVTAAVLLIISFFYFRRIADYTVDQDRNYRKTKHKYELLLYGLLYHVPAYDLLRELEQTPVIDPSSSASGPPFKTFDDAARYLHVHHGKHLMALKARERAWVDALVLVLLVLLIRIAWAFFGTDPPSRPSNHGLQPPPKKRGAAEAGVRPRRIRESVGSRSSAGPSVLPGGRHEQTYSVRRS